MLFTKDFGYQKPERDNKKEINMDKEEQIPIVISGARIIVMASSIEDAVRNWKEGTLTNVGAINPAAPKQPDVGSPPTGRVGVQGSGIPSQ